LFQVDAFAESIFTGNPAGVCLFDGIKDDKWCQNVATEMNLSETAFVTPKQEDGKYGLRWFTPTQEVKLCGHATLAAAHVLFSSGNITGNEIRFATLSGELIARSCGDNTIELTFPNDPPVPYLNVHKSNVSSGELVKGVYVQPVGEFTKAQVSEALGIAEEQVVFFGHTSMDVLLELVNEEVVRSVTPDFNKLIKIPSRCVIITAKSSPNSKADFVSRVFAPTCGIDEDPVTGSAHCGLAPYWTAQLKKAHLIAYQASKRSGSLEVGVINNGVSVYLRGKAFVFFETSIEHQTR